MKKRGSAVKSYQESSDDAQSLASASEKVESGDDISNDEEPKIKRKKSRNKNDDSEDLKTSKKKPGRGKKSKEEENGNGEVSDEDEVVSKSPQKKSGRGRKSKEVLPVQEENGNDDGSEEDEIVSKSPRKKSSRGRKSKEAPVEEEENDKDDLSDEDEAISKKKSAKTKSPAGRKSKNKSFDSEDKENEDNNEEEMSDDEYEVESIIDEKSVKGVRYYLVRWKGYGEESDTWEPASTLNCPDALRDYKKKSAKASEGKTKRKRPSKDKKTPEPIEEWDENEQFEVVRILDVYFRRDGKREFLVAWKGYSSKYDSWEPEENMDCKDLIERFLKKCDQAKEANPKELRVQRKVTDRFTLSTKETGRRLSKRNQGKQRIQYHDAE